MGTEYGVTLASLLLTTAKNAIFTRDSRSLFTISLPLFRFLPRSAVA